MEQPARHTTDFNCVHQDICTWAQKSSLWLLAPLRTLSNWRCVNVCRPIHPLWFSDTCLH